MEREPRGPGPALSAADEGVIARVASLIAPAAARSPEAAELDRTARDRARALAIAGGGDAAAVRLAAVTVVATAATGVAVERRWKRTEARAVLQPVAETLELPVAILEIGVFAASIVDPQLFDLPPEVALAAQLRLFTALAGVSDVSLWSRDEAGLPAVVAFDGRKRSREVRDVAGRLLAGDEVGPGAGVAGLTLRRWGRAFGALVYRAAAGEAERADAFASELASRLGPTLERRVLLERNAARERSLAETSDRRLARLGYDLHDGPLQDVLALGSEVRLFRRQLAGVLEGDDRADVVIGRVDDLEARLVALDRDLRELSRSLESPTTLTDPLPELVAREVESVRRRGFDVDLDVAGSFEAITPSQGIALLRIVQEALQNAEQHSRAKTMQVSMRADRRALSVEVTDHGVGFDVETTVVAAARGGRLGLVGMSERVRLLGGEFDVESTPGGPTSVSATIPRWRPPTPQS